MSTSDVMRDAQQPLAEFAFGLKEQYGMTMGQTREQFLAMYEIGEIQLSSVFENLFVAVREKLGKPVQKISENCRDFSNNGDMKTTVLQKDDGKRRFTVSGVENKIGPIYVVAWNWITNQVIFLAIPKGKDKYPKAGIKITVCPISGRFRSKDKYSRYACSSFEAMAQFG